MPELLWAHGGVCRIFSGFRGEYAGSFGGSRGGMPELLAAQGRNGIPPPEPTKVPAYPALSPQKFRHTPP